MMKYILTLFAVTAMITMSWSQIVWEPEIIVSSGTQYGNLRPRATVVGDVPMVIYGGSGTENLFISRWNGTGFDTQSILPAGTSTYVASWTGADIASFGDTVVAVFKLDPIASGNVYVVRSTDGGVTFSDTIRANNYSGGNAWMPSLEMDQNGNPVVSMMIHDGSWSNPRYAVTHSNDAGLSFDPVVNVSSLVSGEACDCCPSEMVINGSKEMLLFRNNSGNIRDVYAVGSFDAGQNFLYYENVDQLGWTLNSCPSTGMDGIITGQDDDLITVFASAAEGIYKVYVSNTATTGSALTFDVRNPVVESEIPGTTQNYPTISGANDTIVMAWEERISFNKDIYYSLSVPGLVPEVALTSFKFQANELTQGNQTNPDIIYKNGYVHLFYQDDYAGNVMYRRGTIDVSVGLEELYSRPVSAFPNPSTDGSVNVTNVQSILGVYSVSGNQIPFATIQNASGIQINCDGLKDGLYLIQCEDAFGKPSILKWQVN